MKMQYLCHLPLSLLAVVVVSTGMATEPGTGGTGGTGATPAHDYPTLARVEYVNDCIGRKGDKLAALYQCACAIDHIANVLAYDDYVEASTYAKYATLPGQGGGIFRDSEDAKKLAKKYRDLEADAQRGCGLTH